MQNNITLCLLAGLTLVACGGGGGNGSPGSGDGPTSAARSEFSQRWENTSLGNEYLMLAEQVVVGVVQGQFVVGPGALVLEENPDGSLTGAFGGLAYFYDSNAQQWTQGSIQATIANGRLDADFFQQGRPVYESSFTKTPGLVQGSFAQLAGDWFDADISISFGADGSVSGTDFLGCAYMGTFMPLVGPVYQFDLEVSGCAAASPSYAGTGFVTQDGQLFGVIASPVFPPDISILVLGFLSKS